MTICSRYLLATAIFFCALLTANAQQRPAVTTRIDSMQKIIAGSKDDTIKVQLLTDVAYAYNKISPYDGIRYAIQAKTLAEELHWEKGIMRANSCLGANYYSLSDYPNAYEYWLKALEIAEHINFKPGIANHLHNIGNIFMSQKNYGKALEYYNKALKISEEAGIKKLATNSYTSIGNVYAQKGDNNKALEYHFKALSIDEQMGNKGDIAADEINIGSIYNEQGNFTKAQSTLMQALQSKQETGDKNGVAKAYYILGKMYLHMAQGGIDRAANLQHAVTYLDSAVAVDKQIGYLDNMQKSYEALADAHELLDHHKEAFNSYKGYIAIKDSIFSMEKQTEIYNLEKKAEIESAKREAEKEEQEKQRKEYIQIAGISIFILVLITVVLLIRHKPINPRIIDILGTFSVLIIFEFIELLLHARIEAFTHHNLTLTLLCLLVLAAIIIPVHHKIDHWMKKQIGKKRGYH